MNSKTVLAMLLTVVATCVAWAQPAERLPILGGPLPGVPEELLQAQPKGKDKDKGKKPPDKKDVPPIDFTAAPAARSELATGYNPHMIGDYFGYLTLQRFTVFGTKTTTTTTTFFPSDSEGPPITTTTTTRTTIADTKVIIVPNLAAAAFKVAENSSPRPVDRVYLTYNYFSDIQMPLFGSGAPFVAGSTTTTQSFFGNTTTTRTSSFIAPAPIFRGYLHREVLGLEKTFLDGFASIEVRLPQLQQSGNLPGFGSQYIGDMTILGKYAFILDQETGNVLSAGLAVTVPTGPDFLSTRGTIHPTYLQPWGGYIWSFGDFFVQGFHSVVVPTDSQAVTLFFNDVGLNWWLYRGEPERTLNFIVPTVEAHVTTPLNNRDAGGAIFAPDMVVFTGGVHVGLFGNSTLTFGAATPVTGPRLFDVEAFAQFNFRY